MIGGAHMRNVQSPIVAIAVVLLASGAVIAQQPPCPTVKEKHRPPLAEEKPDNALKPDRSDTPPSNLARQALEIRATSSGPSCHRRISGRSPEGDGKGRDHGEEA